MGGAAILLGRAAEAVFRARGDTRTPFLFAVAALVANASLTPLFVFGAGPLPGLEVAGAALATVLSGGLASVGCCAVLKGRGWIAHQRPTDDELRLRAETPVSSPATVQRWRFDPSVARRVIRIGLPVAYSGVVFSVIYLVLTRILGETADGVAAQAALGLGQRGESVAYMVQNGFGSATAAIVGRAPRRRRSVGCCEGRVAGGTPREHRLRRVGPGHAVLRPLPRHVLPRNGGRGGARRSTTP